MTALELSLDAARALQLAAQGLLAPPVRPAGKADVLAAIRRMGALQLDAINVVVRSPYLVLWSRLGAYERRWLDDLLAEGCIFEHWAHAACFLPIEDYPLYRRRMLDEGVRSRAWLAAHPEVVDRVLARIRASGGVRAAEFERRDGRSAGWWDWKPEKRALEHLVSAGELMIARRAGFQRVYDLRERVLPAWDDARAATPAEVRRELALRAVRALGVARPRWVPDYFRIAARGAASLLEELAADGRLLRGRVAGWHGPVYIHPDHAGLAAAAAAGTLTPRHTTLLSPFDPLVWHRPRAEELFDFAYRIETYTPAAKRRYGYFTLPILHAGTLVGRLDPKLERAAGRLTVRALHLEPGATVTDELLAGLAGALQELAAFLTAPAVVVERSEPASLAPALAARLSGDAPAPA